MDEPRDSRDVRVSDVRTSDVRTSDVRIGLVVSKAVGPAVVRNRVKRRLRGALADRLDGVGRLAGEPDDVQSLLVVRALPPAASASYATLTHDLDGALSSARRRFDRRAAPSATPGTSS